VDQNLEKPIPTQKAPQRDRAVVTEEWKKEGGERERRAAEYLRIGGEFSGPGLALPAASTIPLEGCHASSIGEL
jgi:hypothetical protein